MDPIVEAQNVILSLVKPLFFIIVGLVLLALIFLIFLVFLNKKRGNRWFSSKKTIQDLQKISPTQFEVYVSELFKSMGYNTKILGGPNDGGIDVEAEKNGTVNYIQCKKYINRKVPVGAIRDFYGAIVDKTNAGKGYFITTNTFTLEAERFAEDKPIELVDRFKLIKYIQNAKCEIPKGNHIYCPKCGGVMVERKGKYGEFMGCSNYPKCTYTEKIKK